MLFKHSNLNSNLALTLDYLNSALNNSTLENWILTLINPPSPYGGDDDWQHQKCLPETFHISHYTWSRPTKCHIPVWLSCALPFYPVVFLGPPISTGTVLSFVLSQTPKWRKRLSRDWILQAYLGKPFSQKIDHFFAFKTLFNIHLMICTAPLRRWSSFHDENLLSAIFDRKHNTKSTLCRQCMLVVAALGWVENFIWF